MEAKSRRTRTVYSAATLDLITNASNCCLKTFTGWKTQAGLKNRLLRLGSVRCAAVKNPDNLVLQTKLPGGVIFEIDYSHSVSGYTMGGRNLLGWLLKQRRRLQPSLWRRDTASDRYIVSFGLEMSVVVPNNVCYPRSSNLPRACRGVAPITRQRRRFWQPSTGSCYRSDKAEAEESKILKKSG